MATGGSPTVRRRRLGQLLRRFRAEAGLTAVQAAGEVERTDSWLSRLESGRVGLRVRDLHTLLDAYGVTDPDVRAEMEELARAGRERGWWSKYRSVLSDEYAAYIGFEAEASRLLVYEALVVHGLLQTEDYARAVIRTSNPTASDDTVERRVQVRMRRQDLLTRQPPLELWAVFDEAALRRIIGGDVAVHLAQLDHLLEVAALPTIRLQVIPWADASNPGAASAFTVLEFPGSDPEIAYFEGLASDVYEEGEAARRVTLTHEDLRAAALSETSTIALIRRVRDEVA